MDYRFEVALSRSEYIVGIEALTAELAKRDPGAGPRIYERLAAMVMLLLVTGYFFPDAMTGLFFVVVAWGLVEWLMMPRWTSSAQGVSYDPQVYPATYDLTDERIAESSEVRRRQWPWTAVRRVHDRPSAIVVEFVGWDMIVLPERLWPEAAGRAAFMSELRLKVPGASVSAADPPSPLTHDWYRLAAIAAFVDVALVLALLLPVYTSRFGVLAEQIGFAGGMLLFLLASVALGYPAYRGVKAALPKLHARSPLAANVIAQMLIWAFAVWFAGAYFGLF